MISFILIVAAAIYFPGVIIKSKAIFSGRKGPGILQPWFDIFRLLRKGSVYSTSSSFVFQIAAPVYLTTVLVSLLFVPFEENMALFSFSGDFVFFAYLLGLGRFLLILSALDVSSGFEGKMTITQFYKCLTDKLKRKEGIAFPSANLEEEFECEIPDESAEKITTVQQAIDYVNAHQG